MVSILLVLIGCWVLWKLPANGLYKANLLVAWAMKLLAGGLFLWIYSEFYGGGTLTADPEAFMRESKLLRDVAGKSFVDYLTFLFGGETQAMVDHYLATTTHWNTGDLTLFNDSKNVIRINSLIYFISGGQIFVHVIIFTFLSLLGFREVYQTFSHRIHFSNRVFWYVLIGFPSLIFWTGSMLKEPLMMLGFCLLLRAWLGEIRFISRFWRLLLGIVLLLCFKPYVLLCLLPAIIFWWVCTKWMRNRVVLTFTLFSGLLVASAVLLPKQAEKAVFMLTRKQFDFINVGQGGLHAYADTCFYFFRPDQFSSLQIDRAREEVYLKQAVLAKKVTAGKALPFKDVHLQPNKKPWLLYYYSEGCASYIHVTPINNSGAQLLKNAPEAIVNATFRPFFGDPGSSPKFLAVIETILLFAAFFYALMYVRFASAQTRVDIAAMLLFALLLLLLIGWITPVLGAIVRYRIPAYMIFLLTIVLLYIPKNKLRLWQKSP